MSPPAGRSVDPSFCVRPSESGEAMRYGHSIVVEMLEMEDEWKKSHELSDLYKFRELQLEMSMGKSLLGIGTSDPYYQQNSVLSKSPYPSWTHGATATIMATNAQLLGGDVDGWKSDGWVEAYA
uniref:Uncharacterized protein n=1 Tax=Oryza brachyantha TaxID=4533 RepID=J3MT60_ORYBR